MVDNPINPAFGYTTNNFGEQILYLGV